MEVDANDADHWRGYFECTRAITIETLVALAKGDRSRAADLIQLTHDAAVSMHNKFSSAGGRYSDSYALSAKLPLSMMNTPANRRLAVALRTAADAAGVVAAERGLGSDQSLRGLLDMFAHAVELECFGADAPEGS